MVGGISSRAINKLTDVKISSFISKSKAGNAPITKLSDGGGMYLLVTPAGTPVWRLKYRIGAKERLYAIGIYPAITLDAARASTSLALARREPREPALRILREDRAEKKPLEPPHGLDTAVSLAKQCGSLLRGHEKARQLSRFRRSRKIALANRILQAVFDGCLHFVEHFHHSSADSLVVIRKLRTEVAQDATLPGPTSLQDVD